MTDNLIGEKVIRFGVILGLLPFSKSEVFTLNRKLLMYTTFVIFAVLVMQSLILLELKIIYTNLRLVYFVTFLNCVAYGGSCLVSLIYVHFRVKRICRILNRIVSQWNKLSSADMASCRNSPLFLLFQWNFALLQVFIVVHPLAFTGKTTPGPLLSNYINKVVCFFIDQYILCCDSIYIVVLLNVYFFTKIYNQVLVTYRTAPRSRFENLKRIRHFYNEYLTILDIVSDAKECFAEINLISLSFSGATIMNGIFTFAMKNSFFESTGGTMSSFDITYIAYFYFNKSVCFLLTVWKAETEARTLVVPAMDVLHLLGPTVKLNKWIGLAWHTSNSDYFGKSKFHKIYCRCSYFVCTSLQLLDLFYRFYTKNITNSPYKIQEIVLKLSVFCNMSICFLPLRNLVSSNDCLHRNLVVICRYEQEIFRTKRGTLRNIYSLSIAIISAGIIICVVFTCMEAFNVWNSHSVGKYGTARDVIALSAAFVRLCFDILYLHNFVIYVLIYGTCYSNINESISRYARKRLDSAFFFGYLKHLQHFDNALKDVHGEVLHQHEWYSVIMFFLAFLNWFYVIGYIFLNVSPIFMAYRTWVMFISIITLSLIGGSLYATRKAERTASLLHGLYVGNDDPRIQEELEILSLQLLHRKVEFDACGFFKLDFSLLLSMINTVTTYVLILIQFEDNSDGTMEKCGSCLGGGAPLTNYSLSNARVEI